MIIFCQSFVSSYSDTGPSHDHGPRLLRRQAVLFANKVESIPFKIMNSEPIRPHVINIYNYDGKSIKTTIPIHTDKITGRPTSAMLILDSNKLCTTNKSKITVTKHAKYRGVSNLPQNRKEPIILPHLHAIISSRTLYYGEIYMLDTSENSIVLSDKGEMIGVCGLILYKPRTVIKSSNESNTDCNIL